MLSPGKLPIIEERAPLVPKEGSREPHGASHWAWSRIRRWWPTEHLPLLDVALLGPGSGCARGHVDGMVLRASLLADGTPLLLLLQNQLPNTLTLEKKRSAVKTSNSGCHNSSHDYARYQIFHKSKNRTPITP